MPCGSRVVFNCCSILMSMPAAQGQEGRPHRGMPERQTNREGARSCRHLPDSRRLAVRIHCPPPPVRLRTCSFPSGAGRELNHFPQAPGARSARLATRHAARRAVARSGPAVRPTLLPPPCRVPGGAVAPSGLNYSFPSTAGASSARLPTRRSARHAVACSGPAVRHSPWQPLDRLPGVRDPHHGAVEGVGGARQHRRHAKRNPKRHRQPRRSGAPRSSGCRRSCGRPWTRPS